jgi:hypothetical protein
MIEQPAQASRPVTHNAANMVRLAITIAYCNLRFNEYLKQVYYATVSSKKPVGALNMNLERNIMKTLQATIFASLMIGSLAAHAGTPIINLSVGGEISPGVYGQVQFGNGPPPPVVYAQPTIIAPQPPGVVVRPLYLHVPPGHAKNWAKHCREYNACGRPVYFVKSAEYEPGYRARKDMRHRNEGRRDERRGRDKGRGDEGRSGEGRSN